ncbi:MAG: hypothetical protein WA431_13520 [Candidatus Cybelea sp.]
MKFVSLTRYAFGVTAAAAMMAGCSSNGGSSYGAPSGLTPNSFHSPRTVSMNGLLITAAHPNFSVRNPMVPIAPEKQNKKKALYQYASDYDGSLLEFDYPKSDAQIGEITGVYMPSGECADILYGAAKRDFWVTVSGSYQLAEFALGGKKPIKTLSVGSGGEPASCAMDPTTGNLAATLFRGGVVIFQNASGSGTLLATNVETYFDGYDNHGNLYVDGFNNDNQTTMAELPKGSSTFKTLTLSNSVGFPGAVQYDGTYITLLDQEAEAIYGYTCKGTICTLKRTVSLSGASDCVETWIGVGAVFCPDAGLNESTVYKYPAGGSSIATLSGSGNVPNSFVEVRK